MAAPYFMFSPLDRHVDAGLGAMGDSFGRAAETLSKSEGMGGDANRHLPRLFLYRHALELYLKSVIVLLHKGLKLPFGADPPDAVPQIPDGARWRPLHQTHGLGKLYRRFREILSQHAEAIHSQAKTDWCAVPPELDAWISTADAIDSGSTFFRYPTTREGGGDSSKSAWQPLAPESIPNRLANQADEEPLKAFILLGANDEVVESYSVEGSAQKLQAVEDALRQACEMLSGVHFGLRMEFHGGW
jgi:hypothetical protein